MRTIIISIQKIGKVRVSGAEQIKDTYEMAEAKLVRKPSGYYLHILCYAPKEIEVRANSHSRRQYQGWQAGRYGKTISRSAVGQLKKELKKLDSDGQGGRKVIVIARWLPTTQECPVCLEKTKLGLSQRTFICSSCGFEEPRDKKGAKCTFSYGKHELVTGKHLRCAGRASVPAEQLSTVYDHYPFEKTHSGLCKPVALKKETARLA